MLRVHRLSVGAKIFRKMTWEVETWHPNVWFSMVFLPKLTPSTGHFADLCRNAGFLPWEAVDVLGTGLPSLGFVATFLTSPNAAGWNTATKQQPSRVLVCPRLFVWHVVWSKHFPEGNAQPSIKTHIATAHFLASYFWDTPTNRGLSNQGEALAKWDDPPTIFGGLPTTKKHRLYLSALHRLRGRICWTLHLGREWKTLGRPCERQQVKMGQSCWWSIP